MSSFTDMSRPLFSVPPAYATLIGEKRFRSRCCSYTLRLSVLRGDVNFIQLGAAKELLGILFSKNQGSCTRRGFLKGALGPLVEPKETGFLLPKKSLNDGIGGRGAGAGACSTE